MGPLERFYAFHLAHGAEVNCTSAPGPDGGVFVQIDYGRTSPPVMMVIKAASPDELGSALDSILAVSVGLASRALAGTDDEARAFVCWHCHSAVTIVGAGSDYRGGLCPSCLAELAAGSVAGTKNELIESAMEAASDEGAGYSRMTTAACDAVDRLDTAEAVFRACTGEGDEPS